MIIPPKITKLLLYLLLCSGLAACSEGSTTPADQSAPPPREQSSPTAHTKIPPSGSYHYSIAFAEWNGQTMGEKARVVIEGDSVTVIYEAVGQLAFAEAGEVLDKGILRKHFSGVWIISHSPQDTLVAEVGGCTGGPSVIDLDKKIFWMC